MTEAAALPRSSGPTPLTSSLRSRRIRRREKPPISIGNVHFVLKSVSPFFQFSLLEVELAQLVLRSELLVTEDEEFINNFILTEDTMEQYKRELEGGQGSVMKDVLLFSGSLAAVAGAVFFFSERTRCVLLYLS